MDQELYIQIKETNEEDMFQPLSDDEVSNRKYQMFVEELEAFSGLKISKETIQALVWALMSDPDIAGDFNNLIAYEDEKDFLEGE